MELLLASASPRRRALLSLLVDEFDTVDPDIDESLLPHESPVDYVARLAVEKAQVYEAGDRAVIGADTTVAVGSTVLGKPDNLESAKDSLRRLSGRAHQVHTALSLNIAGNAQTRDCQYCG
jgi:septum formation protein